MGSSSLPFVSALLVASLLPASAFSPSRGEALRSTLAEVEAETRSAAATATPASKLPKVLDITPDINEAGTDIAAWRLSYTDTEETSDPTVLPFVQDDNLMDRLPADFPSGTWFRNGAGRYTAEDGQTAVHPFDGDGLISSTVFRNERNNEPPVTFRSRFVMTQKYKDDRRMGKMTRRGTFGTMKSGGILANVGDLNIGNVANTNCVLAPSSNTLYALWEGGRPHALDAATLTMKQDEECDFGGVLQEGDTMSAHYRYDPRTHTYINFGTEKMDGTSANSKLVLYQHDADTYELLGDKTRRLCLNVPGIVLMHDFVITENYMVFSWVKADVSPVGGIKALLGLGPFVDALEIPDDSEANLIIVPRSLLDLSDSDENGEDVILDILEDDRIKIIPAPFFFNFHFGNAFEEESGRIVLDMVRSTAEDFDFGVGAIQDPKTPLWETLQVETLDVPDISRYTVNLDTRKIDDVTVLCQQSIEFPSVAKDVSTQPHRYTYTVASRKLGTSNGKSVWGAASALAKIDAQGDNEFFTFDADEFIGEPTVVRKRGGTSEDACYIMTTVSKVSTQTSDVVILDAEDPGSLQKGPVCRLRLPEIFGAGLLHGEFYDGYIA